MVYIKCTEVPLERKKMGQFHYSYDKHYYSKEEGADLLLDYILFTL